MIQITKRPAKYSPVYNPVIWEVQSDATTLIYFDVKLVDMVTAGIISSDRIFPFPTTPTLSYIDIGRFMRNTVDYQINNDAYTAAVGLLRPVRAYRLTITEKLLDTVTKTVIDGDVYDGSSDINYVFNGGFDRVSFTSYHQSNYLITSTSTATKFLTSKPNFPVVNDTSVEFLYFLQDRTASSLQLRVRTFSNAKVLLHTYSSNISGSTIFNMFRLNVSPKSLMLSLIVDFTNVDYYIVDVVSNGTPKSESRTYIYGKQECNYEYLNLLWVNDLGGVDSYQFINPHETINIKDRFTIKKNIGGIYDGVYTDISNGVYNPSEVIINNTTTGTVSVLSEPLKDAEAYWFVGLFKSKQVFLELPNYLLVPVMLLNTSYQIPRLKYVRDNLNNITVDFTLADGVLPSSIGAYGNVSNAVGNGDNGGGGGGGETPCVLVTIPTHGFMFDGVVGTPYHWAVHINGTPPFDISGVVKPDWMQTPYVSGGWLTFDGTPDVEGTHIPISLYISNCSGGGVVAFNESIQVTSTGGGGGTTVYDSEERSASFTRNNCGNGYTGSSVIYTVPAGTFQSTFSVADANSQRDAVFYSNGQAYANDPANGATCTVNNNFVVYDVWYFSGNSCDGEAIFVNWFEVRKTSDNSLIYRYDNDPLVNGGSGHISGIDSGTSYTLTANIQADTSKTNGISATFLTANTVNASYNEFGANNATRSITFIGQSDNNIYVACSSTGNKCS